MSLPLNQCLPVNTDYGGMVHVLSLKHDMLMVFNRLVENYFE